MDRIVLEGLEFHGYHGVFEEERTFGARFVVDMEMHLELPPDDSLEAHRRLQSRLRSDSAGGHRAPLPPHRGLGHPDRSQRSRLRAPWWLPSRLGSTSRMLRSQGCFATSSSR